MASEKDGSQKLSTLISRSLCLSGTGSSATNLAKNKTLVTDHLFNSSTDVHEKFHGGSTAEGTQTLESDVDTMIVFPGIVVNISEGKEDGLKKSDHVFLLDTSKSSPGYARLRQLHLADTNNPVFYDYDAIRDIVEETTDGVFLSSEKFANLTVSILQHISSRNANAYHRHGPCATTEQIDIHGFQQGTPGVSVKTDTALALVCLEWPVEAKEWITRRRLHNWPNQSLIQRISNKKCYVVPIGNPESEYHVLEWRISYLLCERELVWSFNDTQLHCYYILKKLLRLSLEKVAPDQLSSYHMKTIVFWLSEEKGLSMWFQENLLVCIDACLGRLFDCTKHRSLQHYFNSHANLFGHKFQNDIQRKQVLEKIEEIRTNITTYVLKCLPPMWKWPHSWEDFSLKTCSSAKLGNEFERLENDFKTFQKVYQAYSLHCTTSSILLFLTAENFDGKCILSQLIALDMNPPEDVYPLFIEKTKLFLEWRLSMAYFREVTVHEDKASQAYIESTPITKAVIMEMVSYAQMMDEMSGELYLATIHHFLGDYWMSTTLVDTLLHKPKYLAYFGWCSTNRSIQLMGDGLSKQVPDIKFYGEEGRTYGAYDVIFSYNDDHCVPYPLKFECALAEFNGIYNFIIIHPCIYANFLLCYGHYKLKNVPSFKKTLQFLQMSVDETKGGQLRHHALNLLAFCYLLHGNYQKAMEYFRESFQETDKLNAAAFHIAIILSKRFEKRRVATESS